MKKWVCLLLVLALSMVSFSALAADVTLQYEKITFKLDENVPLEEEPDAKIGDVYFTAYVAYPANGDQATNLNLTISESGGVSMDAMTDTLVDALISMLEEQMKQQMSAQGVTITDMQETNRGWVTMGGQKTLTYTFKMTMEMYGVSIDMYMTQWMTSYDGTLYTFTATAMNEGDLATYFEPIMNSVAFVG